MRAETLTELLDTMSRGESFTPNDDDVRGSLISEIVSGLHGIFRTIRLREARITGPINLEYQQWSGLLELEACVHDADIRLCYLRLKGRISLRDTATQMVDARYAEIDGSFDGHGLTANRGFFGLGMHLTGGLTVQGSVLRAPAEPDRRNRAALDLYRARIGDLYANRATFDGGLYAVGCTIERNVRLGGATIRSRSALGLEQGPDAGDGIDLSAAKIANAIFLWSGVSGAVNLVDSTISLRNASCARLRVSAAQLATQPISIEGLSYTRVDPASGDDILRLLNRSEPFPRAAYAELSAYAKRNGHDLLARDALIKLQTRHTATYAWHTIHGLSRRALGLLTGYGYRSGRALIWLALCFLAASLILTFAGQFVHRFDGGLGHPSAAAAAALTVDQLLPMASFGYHDQWTFAPVGATEWTWFFCFIGLKILAWAVAALFVASVSGLIRRS